jgi:ABC-type Mn2+/Zn2+ transport system ATPase subunit
MNLGITLNNYRCFPNDQPATFRLDKGFTALVGSNNSGKSTLLKFFWEFRPLFSNLANTNALQPTLQGGRTGTNFPSTVRDTAELFCNRNTQDLIIEFDLSQIDTSQLPAPLAPLPTRLIVDFQRGSPNWSAKLFINDQLLPRDGNIGFTGRDGSTILRHVGNDFADLSPLISTFQRLTQCIYIPAYRNAINAGASQSYFDIQTGQAFISQWRAWQAGETIAHSLAARRLIDTIRAIFGYDRLEVTSANNNETLRLFIDDQTYLLPELGSGIAQFFMVLANAAIKKPPFVLIDEPELNLHPSLQREFLQCLASYTTEGVVFATHNLGLALAQADRTYSVQRISHGHSAVHEYGETPRLSEFLGELSFAGYKQLGFDKVLLVEGATDMRAIQHFLSFYGKQDKVVLLPLGGNAMIRPDRRDELQEVQRICPRVSALIDSEKAAPNEPLQAPRQAFITTCQSLSINCHVLHRRSTENYFTQAAIQAVLGSNQPTLGHYDKAPPSWKKSNWRIAQEMDRTDIESTDLGSFLVSL